MWNKVLKKLRSAGASVFGITCLILGAIIIYLGYIYVDDRDINKVIENLYPNFGTDFIGIAITVLILDTLNQRRQDENLKAQLSRELSSTDNGLALRAARELAAYKWLYDESLNGIDISGANLQNANLERAKLRKANLAGTNLVRANLSSCDLSESNLAGANFQRANLEKANFSKAQMKEVNLERADMALVNLDGANLAGANLEGADLRQADISRANLENAKLQGCILDAIKMQGTKYNQETVWPDGFTPSL